MNGKPLPCDVCGERMQMQQVPVWTGYEMTHNFLLICSKCGHGPTGAHESEAAAIQSWNISLSHDTATTD